MASAGSVPSSVDSRRSAAAASSSTGRSSSSPAYTEPISSGPQKKSSAKARRRRQSDGGREHPEDARERLLHREEGHQRDGQEAEQRRAAHVLGLLEEAAQRREHRLLPVGEQLGDHPQGRGTLLAQGAGDEVPDHREQRDERDHRREGERRGAPGDLVVPAAEDQPARELEGAPRRAGHHATVVPESGSSGRGQPSPPIAAASALRAGSSPWLRKMRRGGAGQRPAPAQELVAVGVRREALELRRSRPRPRPAGRGSTPRRRRRAAPGRACPRPGSRRTATVLRASRRRCRRWWTTRPPVAMPLAATITTGSRALVERLRLLDRAAALEAVGGERVGAVAHQLAQLLVELRAEWR